MVAFPNVKALTSVVAVNRLMSHFDMCKDACDDFGSDIKLTAHALGDGIIPGFEVKRVNDKSAGDDWDDWGDDDDDDWMSGGLLEKYKVLSPLKHTAAGDGA